MTTSDGSRARAPEPYDDSFALGMIPGGDILFAQMHVGTDQFAPSPPSATAPKPHPEMPAPPPAAGAIPVALPPPPGAGGIPGTYPQPAYQQPPSWPTLPPPRRPGSASRSPKANPHQSRSATRPARPGHRPASWGPNLVNIPSSGGPGTQTTGSPSGGPTGTAHRPQANKPKVSIGAILVALFILFQILRRFLG